MKKINIVSYKKWVLAFVFLFSLLSHAQAQQKAMYVPDANFRAFLKSNYASCMKGDSLIVGCSAVVNEISLDVMGKRISNLTGLEAFVNLQSLSCGDNQLTSLPALPNRLQYLDCYHNQLASLSSLPNTLQSLRCFHNQLSSLPILPNNLTLLSCFNNLLTSLPTLPNSLQNLACHYNLLTSLPTLPNSLKELRCNDNQISCLPNLPTYPNFLCSCAIASLNSYTLCSAPQLTSFTPQNNQVTNQIVIIGSSFIGVVSVKFNGIEVSSFKVDSPTKITAILPPTATTGKITVTTYNGVANSQENFIVLKSSNKIQGKLILDENANCREEQTEKGMAGILINAGEFYGSTDENGNYSIGVPAGIYQISQILPKAKQNVSVFTCPKNYTVSFSGLGETKSGFDFFNKIENCTALTVDIASDRRRRCFRSQTTVTYKNEGLADAQNVQVRVIYPKYVVPIRSTVNWTSRQDSLLTFNIGLLKAGETRRFVITDSVICGNEAIRGLTQCTKAIISPASSCVQESAAWDRASIELNGYCEGDYANFTLKNIGRGDMRDSTTYRIFFDAILVEEKKTKLKTGESLPLVILGKGRAIRVEATQVPNHPTESEPTTTVEACGRRIIFARAENAVRQLPQDNKSEHSQTSCMEIRDSYDPNDKQVTPIGVTEKKFIKNTDLLEYLVRFQNTGSDTAYTVVIRDTLSKSLDVSSLVVGASSHNYTWSISGKGNPIITFTFNNIYLPHAKVNEPASNGFVKFKIRQTAGNPIGTKITNKAGIYFDFNSPIITNETLNEIGDPIVRQLGRAENLADIVICDANAVPTTAQAGSNQNIINTNQAELSANIPQKGTGVWRVVSGTGRITNPNEPKAQVTNLSEGANVFEWTITHCGKTSKSQVSITRQTVVATVSSSGNTLTASEGDSYQWYKDGQLIAGATGRTFTPTVAGNYTVIVTKSGISATSSPINITGLEETLLSRNVKLYPNPAQNQVVIDFDFAEKGNLKITLLDYLGKKVTEEVVQKTTQNLIYSLETNHLPKGLYLLYFEIENQRGLKKVVKE